MGESTEDAPAPSREIQLRDSIVDFEPITLAPGRARAFSTDIAEILDAFLERLQAGDVDKRGGTFALFRSLYIERHFSMVLETNSPESLADHWSFFVTVCWAFLLRSARQDPDEMDALQGLPVGLRKHESTLLAVQAGVVFLVYLAYHSQNPVQYTKHPWVIPIDLEVANTLLELRKHCTKLQIFLEVNQILRKLKSDDCLSMRENATQCPNPIMERTGQMMVVRDPGNSSKMPSVMPQRLKVRGRRRVVDMLEKISKISGQPILDLSTLGEVAEIQDDEAFRNSGIVSEIQELQDSPALLKDALPPEPESDLTMQDTHMELVQTAASAPRGSAAAEPPTRRRRKLSRIGGGIRPGCGSADSDRDEIMLKEENDGVLMAKSNADAERRERELDPGSVVHVALVRHQNKRQSTVLGLEQALASSVPLMPPMRQHAAPVDALVDDSAKATGQTAEADSCNEEGDVKPLNSKRRLLVEQ